MNHESQASLNTLVNILNRQEAEIEDLKYTLKQSYMREIKARTQGYTEGYNKGIGFLVENLNTRPTPPAIFGEGTYTYKVDNSPCRLPGQILPCTCTAELEVKLNRLVAYFEKRAKENEKRAKNEAIAGGWCDESADRSAYYFSGKADSYRRAAEKLKELLK